MLTLLVTVLATAYFLVPELLARFFIGLRLSRRPATGSRSEEVLRAAFWAIVPLIIAWCTRHLRPFAVPSGISTNSIKVFTALYSDKAFEADPAGFYAALGQFARFNLYLLSRTYLLVILGALSFSWIALRLGTLRARLKSPRINSLLHWIFIPRISEWDVALSPMLVHARKELIVRIDVMTKGGILYRGTVFEKRVTSDGDLATLVIKNAQRMVRADFLKDRAEYEQKKEQQPELKKPDTENYWRDIPGELFLLNGSEIATINVRHVRSVAVLKPSEDERLRAILAAIREQLDRDAKETARKLEESRKKPTDKPTQEG
ncbi:MAG TPA: hypothetical protein VG714_09070 [Acidobacteriaceae bacterium]|nr:hypothetical protein [Acidobacteriaceae bacterium]